MEGKYEASNDPCLVVSIKTVFDDVKNEKNMQFSGGFNDCTLNYVMSKPFGSWLTQLQDMFTLQDYPIDGYCLPSVVTELNFQFKGCSIAYKPVNLPMAVVLKSDCFFISSNMNLEGDSSVLLLLIEDTGLFLSNDKKNPMNLKEHYACVAHLGVAEISTKIDEKKSEMTVSNDMLHLRTCSDSLKALIELASYVINEGDLNNEKTDFDNSVTVISTESTKTVNLFQLNTVHEMNEDQIVQNEVLDAMMDDISFKYDSTDTKANIEVVDNFCFPDETNKQLGAKSSQAIDEGTTPQSMIDALREAAEDSEDRQDGNINSLKSDVGYCILDMVPGSGIKLPASKTRAQAFSTDSYFFPKPMNENYYGLADDVPIYCLKEEKTTVIAKYLIKNVSVTWHMYGGNDFKLIKNDSLRKVKLTAGSKNKVPVQSVRFSDGKTCFVPESVPDTHSPKILSRNNNNAKWYVLGGINRNHEVLMELQLSKIQFLHESYGEETNLESRNILNISDITIYDRLASSEINKFLYHYYSETCPRNSKSCILRVDATTFNSNPYCDSPETAMTATMRPLRLNIDQDSVIFLYQFFNEVFCANENEQAVSNIKAAPLHAPVMTVNRNNVRYFSDGKTQLVQGTSTVNEKTKKSDSGQPIYFKSFVFSPDVPIKIDYHGKHVDMNSEYGTLAALLIGLGQLHNSEIKLKKLEFLNGVLGVDKLIFSVSNEWIKDIRMNQLQSILGGVGPLHSFVQLFSGVKDFFWMPIEQYQKDGRVFRGIQKGTSSFTSSSAYAALDLSGKFVSCIQSAAETMYDMVSPGPSVRHKPYKKRKNTQPQDLREGVTSAVGLVKNGLGDTANAIWNAAAEEHLHKGMSGAVGGVLRQIPPSVVQPLILASEATCSVLGGLKNQFVPDARKEAAEKWKV